MAYGFGGRGRNYALGKMPDVLVLGALGRKPTRSPNYETVSQPKTLFLVAFIRYSTYGQN